MGPAEAQFVQGGLSLPLCSAPLRVGRHRAGVSAGSPRQLRASWPLWGEMAATVLGEPQPSSQGAAGELGRGR